MSGHRKAAEPDRASPQEGGGAIGATGGAFEVVVVAEFSDVPCLCTDNPGTDTVG